MQIKGKPTEPIPPHRILREVFRHYREFEELVAATGKDVIEHGYFIYDAETGEPKQRVNITISFSDLQNQLIKLSDRKKEAVFWNVIMDKKQRDVAEIMNITTVSVGQYVDTGMQQLADDFFAEGIVIDELSPSHA